MNTAPIDPPEQQDLTDAFECLASAMGFPNPTDAQVAEVVGYVLYDQEVGGRSGKKAWSCFNKRLITERELRNLLMAHGATNLSNWNGVDEPGLGKFVSRELCESFERALFGRKVRLHEVDMLDPWETEVDRAEP